MRFELDDGTVIEGTAEEIAKFYEIAGEGSDEVSAYHVSIDGKEVCRYTREVETDKDVVKPTINFKDSYKDESKDVEVGDKIRITDAYMAAGEYENGDIITVKHLDEDGDVRLGSKEGSYISTNEFEVIDDKDVKVGDKIRIVDAFMTRGNYDNGDVLTVSHVEINGNAVKVKENDSGIIGKEYEVIDKKDVKVGDKIRITDPIETDDEYEKGDVFTVRMVDSQNDVKVSGHNTYILEDEFEVIVEDNVQVGDKIRIINAENTVGEYDNGDILTITDVGEGFVKVKESYIVIANEEFELVGTYEAPTPKFYEGDYVVMKDDGVFDDILAGDVVVYAGLSKSSGMIKVELLDRTDFDYTTEDELEKFYHHADDAAFIRAGRRVGEFKDGDIAEVITSPSASPKGTLVEINFVYNQGVSAKGWSDHNGNITDYVYARYNLKLVTPVENRVDIHAE